MLTHGNGTDADADGALGGAHGGGHVGVGGIGVQRQQIRDRVPEALAPARRQAASGEGDQRALLGGENKRVVRHGWIVVDLMVRLMVESSFAL